MVADTSVAVVFDAAGTADSRLVAALAMMHVPSAEPVTHTHMLKQACLHVHTHTREAFLQDGLVS